MINDSLTSLVSNMGNKQRDKLASTSYSAVILSDSELINAYHNSWVARRLVDIPAKDAIKNWRMWQTDNENLNAIEREEARLGIQQKLLQAQKLARVLGGAAIYIGTNDKDLSKPLDPSRIGTGGVRYLTVMDKNALTATEFDNDVTSEFYGSYAYYEVVNGTQKVKIHPSRFILLKGEMRVANTSGWGSSVIQSAYNWARHADSTAHNIANLIFEATINVFKIPDLFHRLGDVDEENTVMKRLTLASASKGITGDLVMDSEEDFIRTSANFGGLSDILDRFIVYVGASQGIPASKFLGQANKGFGDGEDLITNYYDDIRVMQTLELTPALRVFDECLVRSAIGHYPDNISYLWSPLEQQNAGEIANTGKAFAEMGNTLVSGGMFEPQEVRLALINQLV
ncbi:anti-CBASS protein Acb1 family protein, partial [Moraxella caviae]